jgi:hypothetical protein
MIWKEAPSMNEKIEFWIVFGAAAVGGAVLGYFANSASSQWFATVAGAALAGGGARRYVNYSAR